MPTILLVLFSTTLMVSISMAAEKSKVKPHEQQAPVVAFQVNPVYPEKLLKARESGKVIVEFIVSINRSVESAKVVKSSNIAFNNNAVAAIMLWKFKPAINNGKPTRVRIRQTLNFSVGKLPSTTKPPP